MLVDIIVLPYALFKAYQSDFVVQMLLLDISCDAFCSGGLTMVAAVYLHMSWFRDAFGRNCRSFTWYIIQPGLEQLYL